MTQKINTKDPIVIWQEEEQDGIPEQPLIIESYSDVISLTQRDNSINLNYDSIDEVCRALKAMKKEHK